MKKLRDILPKRKGPKKIPTPAPKRPAVKLTPMKLARNIVLGGIGGVVLVGFLLAATYVYWVTRDLPSYAMLEHYEPPVTTRVYAGNGTLIGEYARERRLFVPIGQMPA